MFIIHDMTHDFSILEKNEFQKGWVSAIIPVYEKKVETLDDCLQAIMNQTYKPLEIIVVNNGVKNIGKILSKYENCIKVENLKKNFGASYARNYGACESKGEYLWFVDSDIIDINKNCVKTMVNILLENSDIGALGGIIYRNNYGGTTIHIGQCIDPHFSDFPEKYTLYDDYYVNTGCIIVKRKVFRVVQGFTEYLEYLHEDNDFGYKIKAMGLRCVGDFRTVGLHVPREDKCLSLSQFKMGYKNTILYLVVNYKFQELIKFLYFKFSHKKRDGLKDKPNLAIKHYLVKIFCRLKQIYSFISVTVFLTTHIYRVISLRNKRQSLLRALRDLNHEHY